jgi:hypothetical protein
MTWYTGMYSIMAMGLLYRLDDMVNCVCYMGLESNGNFIAGAAFMGSYYRTYIISGMSYPRLDSVVPLVLCIVAYNIRGTSVVLQVP